MTYDHRNGETEPPTKTGYYWVQDRIDTHILLFVDGKRWLWGGDYAEVKANSRYWGPIVNPTDERHDR